MEGIALWGYGRFGAALADCLTDIGCSVRAFAPLAFVPERLRAEDPRQLVEEAEGGRDRGPGGGGRERAGPASLAASDPCGLRATPAGGGVSQPYASSSGGARRSALPTPGL